MQHDLLNRASRGTRKGHVLHHGVALTHPGRLVGNEGGECSVSLYVSQARVIEDGPCGEGETWSARENRANVVRLHYEGWVAKSIAGYLKTHK